MLLEKFNPSSLDDNILKINCVTKNKDIISERNSILSIDVADPKAIKVTAEKYTPYSTNISNSNISISGSGDN